MTHGGARSEAGNRQLSAIECNRRGWATLMPANTTVRVQDTRGHMHVRSADLFGCIDALSSVVRRIDINNPNAPGGEDHGTVTIAIQFSSARNANERAKKVRNSRGWAFMVDAGWHVVVWGWGPGAEPELTEIVVLDRLPG